MANIWPNNVCRLRANNKLTGHDLRRLHARRAAGRRPVRSAGDPAGQLGRSGRQRHLHRLARQRHHRRWRPHSVTAAPSKLDCVDYSAWGQKIYANLNLPTVPTDDDGNPVAYVDPFGVAVPLVGSVYKGIIARRRLLRHLRCRGLHRPRRDPKLDRGHHRHRLQRRDAGRRQGQQVQGQRRQRQDLRRWRQRHDSRQRRGARQRHAERRRRQRHHRRRRRQRLHRRWPRQRHPRRRRGNDRARPAGVATASPAVPATTPSSAAWSGIPSAATTATTSCGATMATSPARVAATTSSTVAPATTRSRAKRATIPSTATLAATWSTATAATTWLVEANCPFTQCGPTNDDGNDTLDGGSGNDIFVSGNDTIAGWVGDDVIYGRDGNDVLYGEQGFDSVVGGDGDDFITGDCIYFVCEDPAGPADADQPRRQRHAARRQRQRHDLRRLLRDPVRADGRVRLLGYATPVDGPRALDDAWTFDDVISGGAGNDVLAGELGNDTITGGSGNDLISDGPGDDTVDGGSGNDTICAGDDNGYDLFIFALRLLRAGREGRHLRPRALLRCRLSVRHGRRLRCGGGPRSRLEGAVRYSRRTASILSAYTLICLFDTLVLGLFAPGQQIFLDNNVDADGDGKSRQLGPDLLQRLRRAGRSEPTTPSASSTPRASLGLVMHSTRSC